ncbi:MAG: hypothetical protein RLZZ501_2781 [Pseudomonadota bacterium]
MRVGPTLAALAVVTALSGCVRTYWVKPGATPSEWEQVKAACLLEASRQVPVALTYRLQPGSSYTSTNCDKKGRSCSTYERVTPPTWQQEDTNAPLREQVTRGCFARNGWVEMTE